MEERLVGAADFQGNDQFLRMGTEGEFAGGLVLVEEVQSFLIDGEGGGLETLG